jgi:hypothetical protein
MQEANSLQVTLELPACSEPSLTTTADRVPPSVTSFDTNSLHPNALVEPAGSTPAPRGTTNLILHIAVSTPRSRSVTYIDAAISAARETTSRVSEI